MGRRPRTLVAALVVGVAALVPLFGDPRVTPVTHPLWARLLLRALDTNEALRASSQASQVFSLLAWRDSLSLPADRYQRADGLRVRREGGQTVMSADSVPGEASYALAVVQPGDYLVRARAAAPGGASLAAEIASLSGGGAAGALRFAATGALDWTYGGALHLDPGAYRLQFLLGAGCSLARIEIAPPCLNPIEPPGGWRTTAVTTADDLAVTAVKLLDGEHELPPAASPLELLPAQFLVEAPAGADAPQAVDGERAARGLLAGPAGLRAVAAFELDQPGRYTISAFGAPGSGQRWLVDGCRKAVLCAGEGERWRPILSQQLAAGRHVLTLALGAGATLQHVRIERKKDAPGDYVATLERLGFSSGAPGPVTRAKALDAATFLRERRRVLLAALCGDPIVVEEAPPVLTAHAAGESGDRNAPPQPPPAPPTKPAVPPVEPPIGPPILPPQPPATPTEPFGS